MVQLEEECQRLWRPWLAYTTAHTLLNGIVISVSTGDIFVGAEDAVTNIPFFSIVNAFYAKSVDWIVRRTNHGRFYSNLFSIGVSSAFYLYARATNDSDPTLPSAVAASIGLYLTNKQVTDMGENDDTQKSPYCDL